MATPATFKERVAAMVAASPQDYARMHRDIRAEFVQGLKGSGVFAANLAKALGTSRQNLSIYANGRTGLSWRITKHILWLLKGDFGGRARALAIAEPEEVEGMSRDIGSELDRIQRIEGVTQTLTAKALGIFLQDLNAYMNGRRPWPYSVLGKVVWLLDGEKGEGEV